MKYIRTKDKIVCFQDDVYILTKEIVDEGYGKSLPKGTMVVLGKQWRNYYGKWQRIYEVNSNGLPYDISPKEARDSLSKIEGEKDKLEDLCDCFVEVGFGTAKIVTWEYVLHDDDRRNYDVYGAISTAKGIMYVAKMNEKGELELL